MASQKISDMTPAFGIDDTTSEIPVVNAGGNYKATRQVYLSTAGVGDSVGFRTGSSHVVAHGDGNIDIIFPAARTISIVQSGTTSSFTWDTIGDWFITLGPTAAFVLNCNGLGFFNVNSAGNISLVGYPIFITYHEPFPAIWATAAPPDITLAINRLALAVRGLLGVPIP